MAKVEIADASLAATESRTVSTLRFLLERQMRVSFHTAAGECRTGFVHNLDWAGGSDHVFAKVSVLKKNQDEEDMDIRVGIDLNGKVTVLPDDE